ncbi:transporter [Erysipelothrix sp. HDW6C]|uniref:transporter n=1 Tax=Erysipelothrix sp. HDW6C TaxID=2714930 RepID=UPI00140C81BF|nr:transporter [Erysipelothrix sp. HDW6C]QIK69982.1 transporter [Erysipelothrix sp. HDW6C]
MKKHIKSFSISVILIAVICTVLWIGYVGFIGGPARAYEREDQLYVETMMEQKGYSHGRILGRFAYEQVYYITEITEEDRTFIFWFNKDMDTTGEHENVGFDPVLEIASNFGIKDHEISFGVFNERLVYVLKNRQYEKFIDVETLKLVYDRGSGI